MGPVKMEGATPACNGQFDSDTVYRCRRCRYVLFREEDLEPHEPQQQSFSRSKLRSQPGSRSTCASYFVETSRASALLDYDQGSFEGKLQCTNAKCGARVGIFNWAGAQCSCGTWVVPAFQVPMSKVDRSVKIADDREKVQPTLYETKNSEADDDRAGTCISEEKYHEVHAEISSISGADPTLAKGSANSSESADTGDLASDFQSLGLQNFPATDSPCREDKDLSTTDLPSGASGPLESKTLAELLRSPFVQHFPSTLARRVATAINERDAQKMLDLLDDEVLMEAPKGSFNGKQRVAQQLLWAAKKLEMKSQGRATYVDTDKAFQCYDAIAGSKKIVLGDTYVVRRRLVVKIIRKRESGAEAQ